MSFFVVSTPESSLNSRLSMWTIFLPAINIALGGRLASQTGETVPKDSQTQRYACTSCQSPKFLIPKSCFTTVDGWNPAPVDMVNIPLFLGFHTFQVVQDFSHQQYHRSLQTVGIQGDCSKSGETGSTVEPDLTALLAEGNCPSVDLAPRGRISPCWNEVKLDNLSENDWALDLAHAV